MKRHEETMRRIEICRSPSWGAWIETRGMGIVRTDLSVAPPRGERGLKHLRSVAGNVKYAGRSPSWGAWIETQLHQRRCGIRLRRSPSWGAWIETTFSFAISPPAASSRSPSWGAWIETASPCLSGCVCIVAPPRGERGLKHRPRCEATTLTLRRSPTWGAWIETLPISGAVKV